MNTDRKDETSNPDPAARTRVRKATMSASGAAQDAGATRAPPVIGTELSFERMVAYTRRSVRFFNADRFHGCARRDQDMKQYRVKPGRKLSLKTFDPDETGEYKKNDDGKAAAKAETEKLIARISRLQERLYANGKRSLLIVLQGMDTSGKDGTIRSVMSGVNPQGCKVVSFKTPSSKELAHDFLWRVHQEAPARGQIGIFNRSHYEDVLITRVHKMISNKVELQRLNQIKEFEELLTENGTTILKFFLHISKEEQKERLEARIHDPEKQWKWNSGDLEERKLWNDYMKAFEDVLAATSTDQAPWFIVPGNRKWYRNLVVADRVVGALEDMKLSTPPAPEGVDFAKLTIV